MKLGRVLSVITGIFLALPSKVLAYDPSCTPNGFAGPGVQTALGCIPVQTNLFVQWLLPYLFGIAGGISFLLMVSGFISMTMSSGDPKAVQAAQETVTSAIIGLIVSIFALFLLRLIAVNILHIPGIN
jgi:hypothetical protein